MKKIYLNFYVMLINETIKIVKLYVYNIFIALVYIESINIYITFSVFF